MATFSLSLEKTLKWEGGYVNDPDDTGGETYKGIARNHHGNLAMWKEVDNYKTSLGENFAIKDLEKLLANNSQVQNDIKNVYINSYWNPIKADNIKEQLNADVMFDWCVNSGVSKVVKLAQTFLGITSDGIVGNQTLSAINSYENFYKAFTEYRIEWYNSRSSSYDKYKKGWTNRANDIIKS